MYTGKKDKYACFQWIRDIRAKTNHELDGLTPEERVAYSRAKADEVLAGLPKLTIEEARRQRRAILHPETVSSQLSGASPTRKAPARRKASRRSAHA